MTQIAFVIYGPQKPQGSKVSQVIYRNGKPAMRPDGRVLTVTRDSCKGLASWRNQVAAEAMQAMKGCEMFPAGVPVRLEIVFVRMHPMSHYGSGKNANFLKASAPDYPTSKPDLTKLTRAVEDALKGIVWHDDSQVVEQHITKEWGSNVTHVKVTRLCRTAAGG